jgi:integration host factor subunit alpha
MSEKTLTRADIVEAVHEKFGVGRDLAGKLLEDALAEMTHAVALGSNLKVASFGSFSVRQKKERIGRNPKTGEEAVITPRRVLSFRASKILKNRVNIKKK